MFNRPVLCALLTSFAAAACVDPDLESTDSLGETEQELNPTDPDDPSDPPPPPPPSPTTTSINFPLLGFSAENRLDDEGTGSRLAQLYGSVWVKNVRTGQSKVLNFGQWGNPSDFAAVPWNSTNGPAPKTFDTMLGAATSQWISEPQVLFGDTKMCASNSYATCSTPFGYGPQVINLPAQANDTIEVDVDVRDYDSYSADDVFCRAKETLIVKRYTNGNLYLAFTLGAHPYRAVEGGVTTTYSNGTQLRHACKLWF